MEGGRHDHPVYLIIWHQKCRRYYLYNQCTGVSTWNGDASVAQGYKKRFTNVWKEYFDSGSAECFFFNLSTGESDWEPPGCKVCHSRPPGLQQRRKQRVEPCVTSRRRIEKQGKAGLNETPQKRADANNRSVARSNGPASTRTDGTKIIEVPTATSIPLGNSSSGMLVVESTVTTSQIQPQYEEIRRNAKKYKEKRKHEEYASGNLRLKDPGKVRGRSLGSLTDTVSANDIKYSTLESCEEPRRNSHPGVIQLRQEKSAGTTATTASLPLDEYFASICSKLLRKEFRESGMRESRTFHKFRWPTDTNTFQAVVPTDSLPEDVYDSTDPRERFGKIPRRFHLEDNRLIKDLYQDFKQQREAKKKPLTTSFGRWAESIE
eukprot:gb/GECG01003418.1/.p1 GENE.gb/GECG01003418.1/~~gb/GECG01003418.1/.p1  ORF type:complete len:377 (+),score=33.98 gb/GECG01003418.1/:1-1131(+)